MTEPKPKPRIVIELQEDGSYAIISFINGAQQVETIQLGMIEFQVRDALQEQKNRHNSAAARTTRLAQEKAEKLHRKVWETMANTRGQGVAMANRVVGPITIDWRENPSAKPNPNYLKTSLALLDD